MLHPDKKFTNSIIDDVIEYLRKNYREYQRKPENAMRLSVEKGQEKKDLESTPAFIYP